MPVLRALTDSAVSKTRCAIGLFPGMLAVLFLFGSAWLDAQASDTYPRVSSEYGKIAGFVVADRTAVVAGQTFRLVVDVAIEPGWHIYGNPVGPGIGQPTELTVAAPEGIRFRPVLYSPPARHEQAVPGQAEPDPDAWVWAYEGNARFFFQGVVQEGVASGEYRVQVTIDFQACADSCVPDTLTLRTVVNVVDAGTVTQPINTSMFRGMDEARTVDGKVAGEASELQSRTTDGRGARPEDKKSASSSPPTSQGHSGSPGLSGPGELDDAARRAIASYASREKEPDRSLLIWLVFGFLAGIILNAMPCVLPVISIKILSLVQQAKEDRRTIFLHGLVFSAGILTIFLVLAGAAAFFGESWGFHFQSTGFLVAMIAIIFLFALGLFDVYSIEVPGLVTRQGGQVHEGYVGSFSKGMLATLLATPCSGPLLGAVLTYALIQPPTVVFVIFASIGIGMAFPYVVLTAHPAFLRFVPRPGPWMVRFKELMGFFLLATVVYLLGIVKDDLRIWVITVCLILGLSAWIYGRVTGPERSGAHRLFWRASALVVAGVLGYWTYGLLVVPSHVPGREPFSLQRLTTLGQQGRTVMVDWTADWCPNCKYVEKAVLESEPVQEAMRRKGVLFMVADITHNPPVESALQKQLGSHSIPFLGVFPGDDPRRPFTLRDIYSRKDVIDILDRCPEPPRGDGNVVRPSKTGGR